MQRDTDLCIPGTEYVFNKLQPFRCIHARKT